MKLRDFVPPIVYPIKDRLLTKKKSTDHQFPIYSSFREAEIAGGGAAYQQSDLVEVVFRKTEIFRDLIASQKSISLHSDAMTQSLLAFSLGSQNCVVVNVIDLGGACGTHYFVAKKIFPHLNLRWHVVETPQMVRRAKDLESEDLHFFDNISDACKHLDRVDLFHSSGCLQCMPDFRATLTEILNLNAKYLSLNRLSMIKADQPVTTLFESRLSDNGPGKLPTGMVDGICHYPRTFIPQAWLEAQIQSRYHISFQFPESTEGNMDGKEIFSTGYFAKIL